MDSKYEIMNGVSDVRSSRKVDDKYENGGVVDRADSFVVDLESVVDNEFTSLSMGSSNPRITRNLSKKGPNRSNEGKINDRDTLAAISLSPRDTQTISTPKKPPPPLIIPMASQDNLLSQQLPHHQITIKTGGLNTIPEGRWGRRSSFKRSPSSWFAHPKRILFFFATLSCMGTMLLIFFTLSMTKHHEKEGGFDYQQ